MTAFAKRLASLAMSKAPAIKYVLMVVGAVLVLTFVWFDGWKAGVENERTGAMANEIIALREERDRALDSRDRYLEALREDRTRLNSIEETIQDAIDIASDDPAVGAEVTQRLRDVFQGGRGPDRTRPE